MSVSTLPERCVVFRVFWALTQPRLLPYFLFAWSQARLCHLEGLGGYFIKTKSEFLESKTHSAIVPFVDWIQAHRSHLPQLIMQINNQMVAEVNSLCTLKTFFRSMVKAWHWLVVIWSQISVGQDHNHLTAVVEATITNSFIVTLDHSHARLGVHSHCHSLFQVRSHLYSELIVTSILQLVLTTDQWQSPMQGPLG